MIVHLVLGRPRENLSSYEAQELTEAVKRLREVPGVRDFTCGEDFSGRGKGYTRAAVMHFASREDLQAYLAHDLHRTIVETLNRLMPERLVIDYETGTSGIEA